MARFRFGLSPGLHHKIGRIYKIYRKSYAATHKHHFVECSVYVSPGHKTQKHSFVSKFSSVFLTRIAVLF